MPYGAPLGYSQLPTPSPEELEYIKQILLREQQAGLGPTRMPTPQDVAGQRPMTVAGERPQAHLDALLGKLRQMGMPETTSNRIEAPLDIATQIGSYGPRQVQQAGVTA